MRGGGDDDGPGETRSGSPPGDCADARAPSAEQKRRGLGVPAEGEGEPARGPQEQDTRSEGNPPLDVEFSDPDASPVAEWLGQAGVYLGVFALVLAVAGIGAGLLDIRPWSGLLLTLSLVAATVAMVLGAVFQVSTGNVPGFD